MFIRKSTAKAHLTRHHPGSNKSHLTQCETDKALKFIEIQTDVNYTNNLSKISNKNDIVESEITPFFKSNRPKDDNLAIKVKSTLNLGDQTGSPIQENRCNSEQQKNPRHNFKTKQKKKKPKQKETSHQKPSEETEIKIPQSLEQNSNFQHSIVSSCQDTRSEDDFYWYQSTMEHSGQNLDNAAKEDIRFSSVDNVKNLGMTRSASPKHNQSHEKQASQTSNTNNAEVEKMNEYLTYKINKVELDPTLENDNDNSSNFIPNTIHVNADSTSVPAGGTDLNLQFLQFSAFEDNECNKEMTEKAKVATFLKEQKTFKLDDQTGNLIQKHQFNSEQQKNPTHYFETKQSDKKPKHQETSHLKPSKETEIKIPLVQHSNFQHSFVSEDDFYWYQSTMEHSGQNLDNAAKEDIRFSSVDNVKNLGMTRSASPKHDQSHEKQASQTSNTNNAEVEKMYEHLTNKIIKVELDPTLENDNDNLSNFIPNKINVIADSTSISAKDTDPNLLFLQELEDYKCNKELTKKAEETKEPKKFLPYKCNLCSLDFRTEMFARNHIDLFHLNIFQFKCNHCGKTYRTAKDARFHCSKMHQDYDVERVLFLNNKEALNHIEIAPGFDPNTRVKCTTCDSDFTNFGNMQTHSLAKHGIKNSVVRKISSAKKSQIKRSLSCNFCQKSFRGKKEALSHVEKIHLHISKFNCATCHQGFDTKSRVKEHIKEVHQGQWSSITVKKANAALEHLTALKKGTKLLDCSECKLKCEKQTGLINHFRAAHPERATELEAGLRLGYKCSKCSKYFKDSSKLSRHSQRKVPCDIPRDIQPKAPLLGIAVDPETLKNSYSKLDENNERFSSTCQFICLYCNQSCKTEEAMINHVTLLHFMDPLFSCAQCNKRFITSKLLTTHVDHVHLKKHAATCDICFSMFSSAANLKFHMGVHDIDLKYSCNQCDKAYPSKPSLRKHKKLKHSGKGDGKITCEICGALVLGAVYLKVHIATVHQGQKKYSCHVCPKQFWFKQHLAIHVKCMHDKIKDLKCDYCDKMFSAKAGRKQHMISVHLKLKRHECSVCQRMFAASHARTAHMKSIHGISKTSRPH